MALRTIVPNIEEIQKMQKTLPWISLENLDPDGLEGLTMEQKEDVVAQTKLFANEFINGTLKGYDDFNEVFEDVKSRLSSPCKNHRLERMNETTV